MTTERLKLLGVRNPHDTSIIAYVTLSQSRQTGFPIGKFLREVGLRGGEWSSNLPKGDSIYSK